jgi:phage terminase small subunit
VLRGIASEKLLETLTIERKPIGDAVVRRANEGMLVHRELWSMLGLTPESRAEAMSLLESKTPEGRRARERLDTYFETTDSEFQALGIQMNQIYKDSAAIAPDPVDSPPDTTGFDILKEVVISTYPGYHHPHVWLAASGQTPRISSLDLCSHGSFTLFTGVGGDCWRTAVAELQRSHPEVPIAVFSIGFRCDYVDIYRDWKRVRGVEEDGAVLVRPDQFCCWRYRTSSAESTSLLRRALERVLGHP